MSPDRPRSTSVGSIRRATLTDAPGILACLHEAFEPYRSSYTSEAFAHTVLTADSARDRLASMIVLVAVDSSGRILGTVGFHPVSPSECHLRGMAVLTEMQGTGLAGRLLRQAMAEIAGLGYTRVSLGATEPLERAVRFYQRNGFRRSGKVTDFFGMRLREYLCDV